MLHLRAKAKVHALLIREMLFGDDVALTSFREKGIQQLINQFAHAYGEFGFITVEPPVSDHPKCKDLVVADGRFSFTRIEPYGEKGHGHILTLWKIFLSNTMCSSMLLLKFFMYSK